VVARRKYLWSASQRVFGETSLISLAVAAPIDLDLEVFPNVQK